ncbi:annexin A6 isoform X1 [Octopus sinensis]|uniref:Annexin n=1 Tax=Octopus sinensis TaxID=2607531 RepID=A0A7E6EQ95_9MOLL|nr:annexin A6 isoform X1 [Octopus sinensis]XP_036356956.1 annexin A6 isoform X2 [Octopus sinensis]XP_036356957.1 annexin A6 isoform X1 [Octopus sinensis]
MPSAGGVCPPIITPLHNRPTTNSTTTKINISTLIQLSSETQGCRIYFTTDGTKPSHFKRKVAGREITFKYFAPFTLKSGKRTIKTIAVSRDGLQESAVVTKTFFVENVQESDTDNSYEYFRPVKSNEPFKSSSYYSKNDHFLSEGEDKDNQMVSVQQSREFPVHQAWEEENEDFYDHRINYRNSSEMQELQKSIQPTNYSGTQINMFGVPPNLSRNFHECFNQFQPKPTQYGFITEQMIRGLNDNNRAVTIGEIRNIIEENQQKQNPEVRQSVPLALPEAPVKTKVVERLTYRDPPLQDVSVGQGNLNEQILHIYSHLLKYSKLDGDFRSKVSHPCFGKVLTSDFEDEEDCYRITVIMEKPGVQRIPRHKLTKSKNGTNEKKKPISVTAQPQKKTPKKIPKSDPYFEMEMEDIEVRPQTNTVEKKKPVAVTPQPPNKETPKKEIPKSDPYFEMEVEDIEAQEGTVKSYPKFNADQDCELLREAMKGLGTDEETIINVLAYRSSPQRQEILKRFKTMFGKDLVAELKSELSGNLCECVKSLCMAPAEFDAKHLRNAMKGLGTDETVLIEILCTRSNAQIKEIISTYKKIFNRDLEKDIISETSGHFKRLLVALVTANRSESKQVDRNKANQDAKAMYQSGEGKWGTDESKFHTILITRSYPQLRATFAEYAKISRKSIEDALKSELSGDLLTSMLAIVRCVQNKANYFARQLMKSMQGVGTDDDTLVRVVTSRCEIDMVQIKKEFFNLASQKLEDYISGDISGDYLKIILALVSGGKPPDLNVMGGKALVQSVKNKSVKQLDKEVKMESEDVQEDPTVFPYNPFDPESDAKMLQKAMKGFGTDEDAIIDVITHRSCDQRQKIKLTFKTMFGKDLIKELKSELSGCFCDTILGLCMTPVEFDATNLNKAMKGLGTNEKTLIEIICTRTNQQLKEIKEVYKTMFKNSLEDDIAGDTSGHFRNLLISLVQGNRAEKKSFDRNKAKQDAEELYKAGEKKWGTDESCFNAILCSRSYSQLRAIFQEYILLSQKDIEDVIKSEMSGDLKNSMLAIVQCIRNKAMFFASALYKAMKGLGTDDKTVIRIIVSRSEVDMVQIKQEFQKAYKETLESFLKGDLSGDYLKTMLNLTGNN